VSADTSERLCEYLTTRVTANGVVYAVNSLGGGADTDSEAVKAGTEAIDWVADCLGDVTTVPTHQLIRRHQSSADLLVFVHDHDVDELIIGIQKRNPPRKRSLEVWHNPPGRKCASRRDSLFAVTETIRIRTPAAASVTLLVVARVNSYHVRLSRTIGTHRTLLEHDERTGVRTLGA
jgi:hypothetical protein